MSSTESRPSIGDDTTSYQALSDAINNGDKSKEELHSLAESALRELYDNLYPEKPLSSIEAIKAAVRKPLVGNNEGQLAIQKHAILCADLHTDTETLWDSTKYWIPRHPYMAAALAASIGIVTAVIVTGVTWGVSSPVTVPAAAAFIGQYYTAFVAPLVTSVIAPALITGQGIVSTFLAGLGVAVLSYTAYRQKLINNATTIAKMTLGPFFVLATAPIIPLVAAAWATKSLFQAAYYSAFPSKEVAGICGKYAPKLERVTPEGDALVDETASNLNTGATEAKRQGPGMHHQRRNSTQDPNILTATGTSPVNMTEFKSQLSRKLSTSTYKITEANHVLQISSGIPKKPDATITPRGNSLVMNFHKHDETLIDAGIDSLPADMNTFKVDCENVAEAMHIKDKLLGHYGVNITINFTSRKTDINSLNHAPSDATTITASRHPEP